VELATRYNQPTQISSLLAKYAQHLLDENKILQAIELYRKANHFLEAASLLMDLAKKETAKRASPLRIKKLYVLGALLVEEHQVRYKFVSLVGAKRATIYFILCIVMSFAKKVRRIRPFGCFHWN
jgi:WD repeat-containing protein 35